MCVYSVVSDLFVIPWTVACQAPVSTGFPRQEYRSGLPFPTPENLPVQGIKPEFPGPPVLAGRFFTTEPSGKPNLSGEFFLIYSTQKSFIRYAICKHFLPFYRLYFHLMYEEGLQIAEKRREAKGKGEKGRYTHLNAEFQRIARRYKKPFLSYQCKDILECEAKWAFGSITKNKWR